MISYLSTDGYLSWGEAIKKIIAIVGQSNAPGRKYIEQVSQPEHDKLISAFANVIVRQIEYQNNDPLGTPLYDSATNTGTQSPTFSDGALQPRPYVLPTPNMGCELSLGHGLDDVAHNFSFVKFGVGGTSLATQWLPTATFPTNPPGGPNLFNQMVTYLQNAERDLGGHIRAIIWIQGESDAIDPTQAANYGTNLSAFITALRTHWPNLPFVFNRLSINNSGTYRTDVRAGQTTVANTVPGTWMVDCDDLILDSGLHFVPNDYVKLGYRFVASTIDAMGQSLPIQAAFSYQASDRTVNFFDDSVDPNVAGVPNAAIGTAASWHWDFGDGNTSTLQNPVHTYAADGAYTVTLIVKNAAGVPTEITSTITAANPTWTTDNGIAYPANASEWAAFLTAHQITFGGVAAPTPGYQWGFQDLSGNISAQIGGKALTISNTPAYQLAIPGRTRLGIGASGNAQTQSASNTTMPNINAHSVLLLGDGIFNTTATNREQMAWGGAGLNALQVGGGTSKARKRTGSNSANTTRDHANVLRPYACFRDLTSRDELYSDIEKLSLTWASSAGGTVMFTFGVSSDTAAYTKWAYGVGWADVNPTTAEIRHLQLARGYRVTGY